MMELREVRGTLPNVFETQKFVFDNMNYDEVLRKEIAKVCGVEPTIVRSYAHYLGLSEKICSIKEGSGLLNRLFGRELVSVYEPSETKIVEVYNPKVASAVGVAIRKLNRAGYPIYSVNFFKA